jgi:hypothetical protein
MSTTSASASSALIVGFFGLTDGRCLIHDENGERINTYYTLYRTTISALNPDDNIEADICIYNPPCAPLLANMIVAYVMAKLYTPTNGKCLLNSLQCFLFPGDPTTDDYDNLFSEDMSNFAFLLGNVPAAHTSDASGSHFFLLNVSEYVQDTVHLSQIM